MKYITLSCMALLVCSAAFSNDLENPNVASITLSGQVYCNNSRNPLASSIHVKVEGTAPIHLSVAPNGKFTAHLPKGDRIQIIAEADGYESNEMTYSIPDIKRDTSLFVEIFLTPQSILTLEGSVLDAKTNKPIPAELDLYFDSDIVKEDVQVIHDGKYKEVVSKAGWYIIDILSPGYLSVTDTVWMIHEGKRSIRKDYKLIPIEVGLNVVIDNVYFYFGQTLLKPESSGSLDKIVEFIKANPTLELEIAGHTDDEGADDYNLTLSQGRAEAVVHYLVNVGIEPARLTAHGYGETKPIDKAITKAAKAKNRRVEFTIVKK
jgi:flagellar motor protein MotB